MAADYDPSLRDDLLLQQVLLRQYENARGNQNENAENGRLENQNAPQNNAGDRLQGIFAQVAALGPAFHDFLGK